MWKNRLFKNILVLCMALAIVYMTVICAIWVGYESSKSRTAAEAKSQQLVLGIKEDVDKRMLVAASLMEQYAWDAEISGFMLSDVFDPTEVIRVRNKVANTGTSFSQLGFRVDLLNENLQKVVTGGGALSLEEYLDEIGASRALYEPLHEQLVKGGARSQFAMYPASIVSKTTGQEQVLLLYKSYIHRRDEVFFFALFEKSYLLSDYSITGGEAFYLTCREEPLMAFTGQEPGVSQVSDADVSAFIRGPQTGKPEIYQGNVVNFQRSGTVEELGYYLALPQENFAKTNLSMILLLTLATLAALLGGLVLIYMAVRRIYRPVGRVVQEIREHSHSDSTDEMQMIHNTFTDFRSTEEEMKLRLAQNQVYLREKFLKDLLYGIMQEDDIIDMQKRYDLEYLKEDISVTVVEYVDIEHLKGFLGRNDLTSVKREILEYIRTDTGFERLEVFETSESQFVIITAGYGLEEVKRMVSNSLNIVEACYDVSLLGAAGELCQSLEEIRSPFYDALNALGYKSMFANRNMVTAREIQRMNTYYYPLELEKNLIGYIQQGRWDSAEKLINNVMEKNRSLFVTGENATELKFAMLATLKRCVQLQGRTAEAVFDKQSFEKWQFAKENLEEMRCSFLVYFGQLCSDAANARAREGSSALRCLLDYIHENYMKDISLSDAADQYEISQGYVGKLFREHLQTTFKDYLNQYRVDAAKELLVQNPTMKINEIAQRVGFISAVTFNRVFKRYESVSPGEYRKKQEQVQV